MGGHTDTLGNEVSDEDVAGLTMLVGGIGSVPSQPGSLASKTRVGFLGFTLSVHSER